MAVHTAHGFGFADGDGSLGIVAHCHIFAVSCRAAAEAAHGQSAKGHDAHTNCAGGEHSQSDGPQRNQTQRECTESQQAKGQQADGQDAHGEQSQRYDALCPKTDGKHAPGFQTDGEEASGIPADVVKRHAPDFSFAFALPELHIQGGAELLKNGGGICAVGAVGFCDFIF